MNFRLSLFFILIACSLDSCLKDDRINVPFTGFTPLHTDDGWEISGPSAENIDSSKLAQIYKDVYGDDNAWSLRSMLVFRNGRLVAESYLKSENDRYEKRAIWSCTKQVTSLVTGIAVEEGYIHSVNDPILQYLPVSNAYPGKADITIANLLTMRSGIDFDNDYQSDVFRMHKTGSSLEYVLGNDLKWQPGTYFQYNDGAPQLISGIIQHATGMSLSEFASVKLFSKIGLTNYEWADYSDGVTLGAFGLRMPPRELAKIALCVCDSGMYNGTRVVPVEWLRQALSIKVPGIHGNIGFGYFWWVNQAEKYVYMWGHGGQYTIIYPEKRLIVIFTGLEQADDNAAFWYDKATGYAGRIAAIAE